MFTFRDYFGLLCSHCDFDGPESCLPVFISFGKKLYEISALSRQLRAQIQ